MNEVSEQRIEWSGVRSVWAATATMIALVVTVIWAATGGAFWPVWVWLGLSIPFMLRSSLQPVRLAPRRWKAFAVQAALSGVDAVILTIVWGLTGFGWWLFWPLFGLSVALGFHGLLVGMWHTLRPGEREQELERARRRAHPDAPRRARRPGGRAAADRARPARRRAGPARGAEHAARARRGAPRRTTPRWPSCCATPAWRPTAAIAELRDLARGIAPPVLADRGLRGGRGCAGQALARSTVERRRPDRPPAAAGGRVRRLLRGRRGADQRRQARPRRAAQGRGSTDARRPARRRGRRRRAGRRRSHRQRAERACATASRRSTARCPSRSVPGEGTTMRAELPCE